MNDLIIYMIVMAGVTYLIRMIPLVIFRKKIDHTYVKSFLFYVPYTVLGSMTFPAIFYSTSSFISAAFGTCVALYLSYKEKSLVSVAVLACVAVFFIEIFI